MFIYGWWEFKIVQPLWKIIWQFIIKLNIQLLYDPQIPLLGIYLRKMKISFRQKPAHKCPKQFHPKSQKNWKQYKYLLTGEWINYGMSIKLNATQQ